MRFIDIDELWGEKVQAFEAKAGELLEKLREMSADQRNQYISDNANWSDLKQPLADLFHGKCWYSECRSRGGDRDVDHFRPKGKIRRYPSWPEVEANPDHNGYWWLAFNWRNYRYSSRFCNAPRRNPETESLGGKWNYFPVRDEAARVKDECDVELLYDEHAVILDPTDADDVDLLTFDEFGRPRPRSRDKDAWEYKRTILGISLLNLDHPDFVKERARLARQIKRLVRNGTKAHRDLRNGEPSAKARLRDIKADLKRMIDPTAEFSRYCEIVLRGYREHDWVDQMV
ncbi:hypothetical protein RAD16_07530 [Bradyrhizobium sp. 18BD]